MYDTSYDGTAGYLVENPINRYLINSTTPGLVYGEDGSLALSVQNEQPQEARRASQLAARARRPVRPGHAHVLARTCRSRRHLVPAISRAQGVINSLQT